MSYFEEENCFPEPSDIENGELLPLSIDRYHYLTVQAQREGMILVKSNLEIFDNLWIPKCSMLIHENRLKMKKLGIVMKPSDRFALKNYMTTRKF